MALLFHSFDDDPEAWRHALRRRLGDLDFRVTPDLGEPADIEAALVWLPPPGLLASLPNLKAIFSLAAGVDALLRDTTLPDIPICRMVDGSLTRTMSEFVLTRVLHYHRQLDVFDAQQRGGQWLLHLPGPPEATVVGILGLGVLGSDAAGVLLRHGFTVRGWSRSAKRVAGVESFAGAEHLAAFLDGLDVLVCLLPLTAETEGILARPLFDGLKPGCRLIQVGRGRHLVEADLLAALETGRIGHATLDVFTPEPLPEGHAFWSHPKLTVTPHAASYSMPESGADTVAENYRRLRQGLPLEHVVDRVRGY